MKKQQVEVALDKDIQLDIALGDEAEEMEAVTVTSNTGSRNLTIAAHVRNVFNRRPPIDYRAIDESGGGVIPQSINDVTGRVVRVTLSYKFQ